MMQDKLTVMVAKFIKENADSNGVAITPIADVIAVNSIETGKVTHRVYKPLICLVLQGAKKITFGKDEITAEAGQTLVVSADVPISSEIIKSSPESPYMSLIIDLDLFVIHELNLEIVKSQSIDDSPIQSFQSDVEIIDVVFRLMKLIIKPQAIPILRKQLIRELHYWLLVGKHGQHLRKMESPESSCRNISKAISILHDEYNKPLKVNELAKCSGMSISSFYYHFRSITNLTPIQFQKQLRLIESNRLMVYQGLNANSAAFEVGYESASHFSRDYTKMFGEPPKRHVKNNKNNQLS
jgi:AraC-like DNA-binding protein